jgi:hypothetical protein
MNANAQNPDPAPEGHFSLFHKSGSVICAFANLLPICRKQFGSSLAAEPVLDLDLNLNDCRGTMPTSPRRLLDLRKDRIDVANSSAPSPF